MGIFHSFLLGAITSNGKQPSTDHTRRYYHFFSSINEWLRKFPSFLRIIFITAVKNLFRKAKLLFFSSSKPPSINTIRRSEEYPLLVEKTRLVSSPNHDDEPISQELTPQHNNDDDRDTLHVECSVEKSCPGEDNSDPQVDHVVIAIAELEYSLARTSVAASDLEIVDSDVSTLETSAVVTHENVEEEEKREVIKKVMLEMSACHDNVAVAEARWIKHYNSLHNILLVGEGDFSFSACLAVAFGTATNMIATSLDSKASLEKNYKRALSNIEELSSRGCMVMHEINATKMAKYTQLKYLRFDRIIFNFPFAGFFKDLPRESQLRRHRRLVSKFLQNAKEVICENGEIHISHKTNGFHSEWKLESIASSHGLKLIEAVEFEKRGFPGYNAKCGFGGDNNFDCDPSKTYKFGLKMV